MIEGQCLCGAVRFEILGDSTDIYECHCSVCRRATGTIGIAVFVAEGNGFRWLQGEDRIHLYESKFWVPAGLIQGDLGKKVGAHIFVGPKAPWHHIRDDGVQFEEHFPAQGQA